MEGTNARLNAMRKYLILTDPDIRTKRTGMRSLVEKYLHRELPEQQEIKFEALMGAMKKSGMETLSQEEEEDLFQKIVDPTITLKQIRGVVLKSPEKRIRRMLILAIVALLGVIAYLTILLYN